MTSLPVTIRRESWGLSCSSGTLDHEYLVAVADMGLSVKRDVFDLAMRLVPLPIRRNRGLIRGMNTPARSRCLAVATLSLLLALSIPVAAQDEAQPTDTSEPASPPRRLFVSDKLVLNVYAEPGQGGSRVATIET